MVGVVVGILFELPKMLLMKEMLFVKHVKTLESLKEVFMEINPK